jgi:hypothetical protein
MPRELPPAVLEHMQKPYNPQQRHDYYEAHKKLKGRQTSVKDPSGGSTAKVIPIKKAPRVSVANQAASEARVSAIRDRLNTLRDALQKALAEKSSSSSTASSSDKKKPVTDKALSAKDRAAAKKASQKYRDSHKQEIAAKAKTIDNMSVDELRSAIQKVEANLRAAVQQARTQTASNGR